MGEIRIGTASWTDKTLIASKRFYPKRCNSAEDRLRFYASRYRIVEIDSSYYAMPSAANAALWVARTPDDFTFNIKAYRLFTGHQTPLQSLPKDIAASLAARSAGKTHVYYRDVPEDIRDSLWQRFERAIRPLAAAGRLGAVHFQFPPWVTPGDRACAHIEECGQRLAGYQLATEFRRGKWFDDAHREHTLAFERRHGFAHVVLDMPQGFDNSVPQLWEATTSRLAVVRLHGRNHATWDPKAQAADGERFNYDYSDEELQRLAPPILALAARVDTLHVIFNNTKGDPGQRNAATLMQILAEGR